MGLQVKKASVVALAKATTASCGAKAAACAELAQLAQKSNKKGGFRTAEGVCLPFGCMEAVIQVSLGHSPLLLAVCCGWTLWIDSVNGLGGWAVVFFLCVVAQC